MGIVFMDGFDHYPIADITKKWTSASNTIAASYTLQNARTGVGLQLDTAASRTAAASKTITDTSTIIVGFAFKTLVAVSNIFLRLYDSATLHIVLTCLADGTITISRDSTVLATSTNALSVGVWYYIELKVTIGDSGTYELRVNGTSTGWIPSASGDTQNGGNASVNSINLLSYNGNTNLYDDLYIIDATTAGANDFLGDVKIETLFPNANGTNSDFTGSDSNSTDNYLLVDEASFDTDTTYVASSTVNHRDTYNFANAATVTDIKGIQINSMLRKDDAGDRVAAATVISGATTSDVNTEALSTDYLDMRRVLEVDPNTSAAWTPTNLNAAEFGVKVVS